MKGVSQRCAGCCEAVTASRKHGPSARDASGRHAASRFWSSAGSKPDWDWRDRDGNERGVTVSYNGLFGRGEAFCR